MSKTLRFNKMPDQKKFEIIIYGSIMAFLASFVSSLMSKGKTWEKVRVFLAGTCAGILFQLGFLDFQLAQGWKNLVSSTVAAFITTIWPAIEKLLTTVIIPSLGAIVDKYFKKKSGDSVSDNKPY